jgi:DnaK suppressor protein
MTNAEQIRERLLARQRDLRERMTRLQADAQEAAPGEVQDEIDRTISSEAQTASFDLNTRDFSALEDVKAALARLDNGTYGICVLCSRPIEPARLEAIPETPYCREDAERMEKAQDS